MWRSEQQYLLRKKVTEAQSLISPEKAFILPSYAERHARIIDSSQKLLRWESKGRRSKRGPDGKFSSSRFVDDQAGVSKYLDLSAESTSASESSASDEPSGSSSSRGTASDESSVEYDPPVNFVTFAA
ncbi:unnamed protein product [Calypogeia fissa]